MISHVFLWRVVFLFSFTLLNAQQPSVNRVITIFFPLESGFLVVYPILSHTDINIKTSCAWFPMKRMIPQNLHHHFMKWPKWCHQTSWKSIQTSWKSLDWLGTSSKETVRITFPMKSPGWLLVSLVDRLIHQFGIFPWEYFKGLEYHHPVMDEVHRIFFRGEGWPNHRAQIGFSWRMTPEKPIRCDHGVVAPLPFRTPGLPHLVRWSRARNEWNRDLDFWISWGSRKVLCLGDSSWNPIGWSSPKFSWESRVEARPMVEDGWSVWKMYENIWGFPWVFPKSWG